MIQLVQQKHKYANVSCFGELMINAIKLILCVLGCGTDGLFRRETGLIFDGVTLTVLRRSAVEGIEIRGYAQAYKNRKGNGTIRNK